MIRLVLLFLCSVVPLISAHAQVLIDYSGKAEEEFRAAVALYDSGQYREAVNRFDSILRTYPRGHRLTGAFVMKGKALFQLQENLEAAKTMKAFLSRFPASLYAPDAELVLGLVYNRIERHDEAMDMFLSAYRHLPPSAPPRLTAWIIGAMDSTVDNFLSTATLRQYLARSASVAERQYLWLKIASSEAAAENSVAAAIALDSLNLRYPGHPFAREAALLAIRIQSRSRVKLGALLPLMRNSEPSAAKEIGNEVYEGIAFAIEKYSKGLDRRVSVELETRDTERDTAAAIRAAEDLSADREVIGLIGPVFSTETFSAAAVANIRGIPLVTPTANTNGLASVGRYVFQANPDYDARGRAMARYAVKFRGMKTLAVLAPSDTYARYLAEGFVEEAGELGANVIATETYQRGASDLKPQLAKIRRAGMLQTADVRLSFSGSTRPTTLMKFVELGVPVRRLDSLMSNGGAISARSLLGDRARRLIDSLSIPITYDESQVDSLEYPVDGIDAIYVPISGAEEIGVVASQIIYFNFHTQILGSGEWDNYSELNANKRYCDGVIFESDSYPDTTSREFDIFKSRYAERFQQRPTKNTLYGYDVAELMLDLIRNGATTREALQRGLAGVQEFQTFHTKIGFGPERVNGWLTILQYAGDEIVRIDEINAVLGPKGGVDEGRKNR
jgi:ABC-type branched-subunit amino acid transport system substrate-binding protein/outer membrane protein assembly factor BamD (BamD/ComL family)